MSAIDSGAAILIKGDSLGDRMKGYELAARTSLPWRIPVLLRVDGKAFHSYTHGLERPFDSRFMAAMNSVAISLCSEIDGARLAFVQSDEVTVFVHNYRRLNTEPWFANEVQKMVSVAASIAASTMTSMSSLFFGEIRRAHFDARVFVLPEAEVCNAFLWRQQDATRNSIQMLARAHFSHAQCHRKNASELQEMLFREKGVNWNDLRVACRRGRCVLRRRDCAAEGSDEWMVDESPPIFSQDRAYIEKHLAIEHCTDHRVEAHTEGKADQP